MITKKEKIKQELAQFEKVWHGGYFTGYSKKRNQKGLEQYLLNNLKGKVLLEIGCGGGQWTKFIYEQNIYEKIICVDVLSAEHNKFWENLGEESKKVITYFQVNDFNLSEVQSNSIDYVFSYDVFCHISYSGIDSYLAALSSKCKNGSQLLIMYADPKKYLKSEPENKYHVIKYLPKKKMLYKVSNKLLINDALADSDGVPSKIEPRWFWIGKDKFIKLAKKYKFNILDSDLNIDKTNPITLLQKN